MTRTLPLLPLLLLLAGASAADTAITWRTGLYEAYVAARDAKLPLVVYLHGPDSGDRAQLESELAAVQVAEGAAIFVRQDAAQDDASGNVKKLRDALGLRSAPVVVVLRCGADKIEELGRIEGVAGAGAKVARLVAGAQSDLARMIADTGQMPQRDTTVACEFYRTTVERDGWKFPFEIAQSTDGQFVWVSVKITTAETAATAPASALLGLLAENDKFGPDQRFQLGKDGLFLSCMIRREGMTATSLSTAIDALVQNVMRTESLWNPTQWNHAS